EELLRAYGRFIESLGGRYITAEDVGTSRDDMDMIRRETRYVTGVSPSMGGSGDPSPITAYGVYLSMLACAQEAWHDQSLERRREQPTGTARTRKGPGGPRDPVRAGLHRERRRIDQRG